MKRAQHSPYRNAPHIDQLAINCRSIIMSGITPQLEWSTIPSDGPQPLLAIPTTGYRIWSMACVPDGRRVVTGSHDGTLRVWNMENGKQEGRSMQQGNDVYSLAVSQDGKKIISGAVNGSVKVWDVESHHLVKTWAYPGEFPSIAISPDDRLVAVGNWTVFVHAMEGEWQVNHFIVVGQGVFSMSFSPDGNKLACGTDDDVRVYDVGNRALILGPLKGHQGWIWSLLWSHDGSRLFSGSCDKTIRCWSSITGEPIGPPWMGHTGYTRCLSLSPDGSILASASSDQTVRFWHATSGHPITPSLRHERGLDAVCFSPLGEFVVSAGWDGKICLWRVPCVSIVMMRIQAGCTLVLTSITLHFHRYIQLPLT